MANKNHDVGSDPFISLKDLKVKIDEWIAKYGEDAIFTTDAGYNNVSLIIDTRKGTIKKYRGQQ